MKNTQFIEEHFCLEDKIPVSYFPLYFQVGNV